MPKLRGRELRCFFDLTLEGEPFGRLVFRLRPDVVPKTAENFRALCTGEKGYGFKGTKFHRIVKDYLCQAGDFSSKNDGTGGFSIYRGDNESRFEDENFILKHSGPGVISMANRGPDTNGGQFFITLRKLEELDGKNVVFGSVVEGMDLVWQMEEFGSEYGGKPDKHVVIAECGEVTD